MIPASQTSVVKDPMLRVREELDRLRQSPCTPVLLVGPAGAGKQHTAELLHQMSYAGQDGAPFVTVDCAALPREFLDSELFGHERGAFAEASEARRGLVELAHGGSLFLHEVPALPLPAQSMLLKFLDGMRLRRLGAQREQELNVRVIATASREPRELVKSGQFHEDLYRRLSVFRVDVPALHERADEILPLALAFAQHFAARMKKDVRGLSDDAQNLLLGYGFPGNVRELRTIIERAVMSARGQMLGSKDLSFGESGARAAAAPARFFQVDAPADGVPPPLDVVEQAYVRRVLEHTNGKRMAAAQLLGISYPTFLKRLRELGLDNGHADSGPRSAVGAARVSR
ncbi:MAG TPA: sigma 54-interacting transcriptional regulator [Polyangiaceae bacterium]|nr:sigma 54-interacting transcriptional regulator [Polyangiaceae bacterium]